MAAGPISERNQDATVYVGGLDEKVTESILWELFLQAGVVQSTHMPKDRITGSHQGYGFVEFLGEEDADYAIKVMNMIKVHGKPIRVNKASLHQKNLDVGANLFIGNLDPEIDEKLLYDTFSAFGVILQTPKIMRDPDTGNSKGFAFINFASFDASDAAQEAMNGQHLCNRTITISYAFKKDAKGERHGGAAERVLAKQNPLSQADRPHTMFADAPSELPPPPPSSSSNLIGDMSSMMQMPGGGMPPLPMPGMPPMMPPQMSMSHNGPPVPPPMGQQMPPLPGSVPPMMQPPQDEQKDQQMQGGNGMGQQMMPPQQQDWNHQRGPPPPGMQMPPRPPPPNGPPPPHHMQMGRGDHGGHNRMMPPHGNMFGHRGPPPPMGGPNGWGPPPFDRMRGPPPPPGHHQGHRHHGHMMHRMRGPPPPMMGGPPPQDR